MKEENRGAFLFRREQAFDEKMDEVGGAAVAGECLVPVVFDRRAHDEVGWPIVALLW